MTKAAGKSRCVLLLTALAAAASLALPAVAGAKRAPANFLGLVPNNVPSAAEYQLMAQSGADRVRFLISWPAVQPTASGPYDWSQVDAHVAGAASNGIRMLPFFYGTPAWAANCSGVSPDLCARVSPTKSAAGASGWSALLSAAVARYGPTGTFWTDTTDAHNPPFLPITTWQIGNEANSAIFAPPKPSVGDYYRLLKISRAAIRGVDPNADLMLAGLFGLPSKPGITIGKFLDRLYAKKGAKGLFDAVAVHPYSPNLKKLTSQLETARDAMIANGDRKTPIAITELGWGSASPRSVPKPLSRLLLGPAGQARMLRKAFKLLIRQRRRFALQQVFWFTWKDVPTGTGGRCYLCESAGLLTSDGSTKPAFSTYAQIAG